MVYRFGTQGALRSEKKGVLPVQMFGTFGELHAHLVPGACPEVLFVEALKKLDNNLHLFAGLIDVGAASSSGMPVGTTDRGVRFCE